MTRTLPAVDTVTYDGFTFPAAFHSSVSAQPIESSDGRNHKYSTYRLRVSCVLVAADLDSTQAAGTSLTAGFATDMNYLRKKLLRSGKTLTIVGIGLNIVVNNQSAIGFGPKPKLMNWEILGANQAINFTWEVEFTLTNCESTLFGPFAEFGYSVAFSVSEDGLTTRIVSGEYEGFVGRSGNNIVNTSDTLWDQILLPRIPGFVRTHDHVLSPDKKTTRFTITDREHESDNPLYPGMIRMDIQQNIRSTMAKITGGNNTWNITISGSITVAPGVARSLAWIAFLVVFRDRFDQRTLAASDTVNDIKGVLAITHIDITENIFARSVSFSVGYTMVTTLPTILAASGFGRPVPGNWNAWSASLEEFSGPRGLAGLRHYASDDVIVDFCGGNPIPTQGAVNKRSPGYDTPTMSNDCPPEASSWYSYHWGLHIAKSGSKVYGSTMGRRTQSGGKISSGEPGDDSAPGDDEEGGSATAQSQLYIYSRGEGTIYVTIYGSALRIGYHVNIPKITSVGGIPVGQPVWEENEASHVVGNAGGCKMYKASWKRTYAIKSNGVALTDNIPNQFKKPDLESPNQ